MALASIDGAVMDAADATIAATDPGLLRGDGVFEVVRLYGGRPWALDEHLERMAGSAERMRLPLDVEMVRAETAALLAAAGAGDAIVRIVATRGGRRILLIEDLPDHRGALRLGCVTYAPVRTLDGVKSLSYGANMLATRLAKERGFDEALLVTPHGRVLEAPTSSLFYVLDGELWTPPLSDHLLDSITRRAVVELSGARERSTTTGELARASEAFIASTTREVQAVAAVEDDAFAGAPGPVTQEAARALRARIESTA